MFGNKINYIYRQNCPASCIFLTVFLSLYAGRWRLSDRGFPVNKAGTRRVGTELRSYVNQLSHRQVTAHNTLLQPKMTRLTTVFQHTVLILVISILTKLCQSALGHYSHLFSITSTISVTKSQKFARTLVHCLIFKSCSHFHDIKQTLLHTYLWFSPLVEDDLLYNCNTWIRHEGAMQPNDPITTIRKKFYSQTSNRENCNENTCNMNRNYGNL